MSLSSFGSLRQFTASASAGYFILCGFLVLVLLTGGSARPDVASLILLRPVAVIVLALGLVSLNREQFARHRFLFAFAGALLALLLLYLIPLPPALWSALSGRELVLEIDRVTGLAPAWRPLSMAPGLTWNALFALVIPLAVLVHGVQLTSDELKRLMFLFILACFGGALLALLQILGPEDGLLYLYRITNNGAAVGLFANRNHQAIFLAGALPMLAAYAAPRGRSHDGDRRRLFLSIACGLFVFPLLLVTGSRAGLAAGAIGLLCIPIVYNSGVRLRREGRGQSQRRVSIGLLIAAVLAAAVVWTVLAGRAEALRRALNTVPGQELRYEKWTVITDNLSHLMPFGTGPGTYEPAFQTIETPALLAASYSNHAHNDWLEVVMTTGVLGGLLLAIAAAAFLVALWQQARRGARDSSNPYRWVGLFVILMVAIASAVDYPVRTPTISALLVVACLWVGLGQTASASSRRGATEEPLS